MSKVALVLSGGGGKGAYQVGVIQALLELGIEVEAVAGTSIGALNGAVLASAPSLKEGHQRLVNLWHELGQIKPLQTRAYADMVDVGLKMPAFKQVGYLSFLLAAGLKLTTPVGWAAHLIGGASSMFNAEFTSLFDDQPLQTMMQQFLDITTLQTGLPFYVSVFNQDGYLKQAVGLGAAELLGLNNQASVFKHIQAVPDHEEQKSLILASAALPFLFKPHQSEDTHERYTDGGQGGWIKAQGNTPITPLIDAGYKHIVVTHLNHSSLWHRHDFPEATIYEVRPRQQLDLGFTATLSFSKAQIDQLIQAGYQDTMRQLGDIQSTVQLLAEKRQQRQRMRSSAEGLSAAEDEADKALSRLK